MSQSNQLSGNPLFRILDVSKTPSRKLQEFLVLTLQKIITLPLLTRYESLGALSLTGMLDAQGMKGNRPPSCLRIQGLHSC